MAIHMPKLAIDKGLGQRVIQEAVASLLGDQAADGAWPHGIEMGAMPDAQTAVFLYLLDQRDPDWTRGLVRRMLETQNPDGSWSPYLGAQGDLSTTVECHYALTLYHVWSAHSERRLDAEQFILRSGGLAACRNLTKVLLAIGGEIPWTQLPPPALYAWLWSRLSPIQMQDMVTFTRLHVASMVIVSAHRYVSPVVTSPVLNHLIADRPVSRRGNGRRVQVPSSLLRRCTQYLYSQREQDGTLAGYHSSTFLFLCAQAAAGYPLSHPDIRQTVQAIRRTWGCPFGDAISHQQTCDAYIWNTALTLRVLRDAGLPLNHPSLRSAARFLVAHQHTTQWDTYRQVFTTPGGWGFSSNNTRHPDTDDTVAEGVK